MILELRLPFRDGTTHFMFEPLVFIERLAAVPPRPRRPSTEADPARPFAGRRPELFVGSATQAPGRLFGRPGRAHEGHPVALGAWLAGAGEGRVSHREPYQKPHVHDRGPITSVIGRLLRGGQPCGETPGQRTGLP